MAFGPRFSSDGGRIVFVADTGGIPQAWQVEPDGDTAKVGWPEQMTFGENRVMHVRFSPRPGDDSLIYTQDVGGDQNAQFFLLSDDGAEDLCLAACYEQAIHISWLP